MKFGPVATRDAAGAVLAHSLALPGGRLRKGRVLGADDIATLLQAGIGTVTVARLGPTDVPEDRAAARLAAALVPDPEGARLQLAEPFTGRVNIKATSPGILALEVDRITALNGVHPEITLATLPQYQRVTAGIMAATVKIIAYGVPEDALAEVEALAHGTMAVKPARVRNVGLVVTQLPGGPDNAKGVAATANRIAALGATLCNVVHVRHETPALAGALSALDAEMCLILTASATSDMADVAPAAIVAAGGHVDRFGMPVDPGNLLVLGALGGRPVIGLPGCARSPALNGADWVLERLICGVPVGPADIAAMGVGGLLKEIPTRPQPRDHRAG